MLTNQMHFKIKFCLTTMPPFQHPYTKYNIVNLRHKTPFYNVFLIVLYEFPQKMTSCTEGNKKVSKSC